jgi:uncharacterized DUF497 family protein
MARATRRAGSLLSAASGKEERVVRTASAGWAPVAMPFVYAFVYTNRGGRPVEFDWDEANTAYIARHGVRPEEALTNPRRLVLRIRSQAGEERWAALGATEASRILFVVFTRRRGRVRVIAARDATLGEKRRYRKRGK